jgi:predicted metal-dependent peptidase
MDITKALDLAKVDLFARKQNVFICSIFCSLQLKISDEVPTACTDGTDIKINPDFFMGLPRPVRVTLLAHETWHVALKHVLRLGGRDPKIWNIACDYYINNMLDDSGYTFDGVDGYLDHQYDGLSAPEIYQKLIQNGQEPQKSFGQDLVPAPAGTEDALDTKIDSMLIRGCIAAQQSNQFGSVPNNIKAYIDELLNPKLPWNDILRNFVNEMTRNDYTWAKPNKRYLPDIYLPSLNSEGLEHIIFYTDISGSVTDAQFGVYISEIHAIKTTLTPKRITVCTFDTEIHDVHELEEGDDITQCNFHGRGGTSLDCVYEHAKKEKPELIVIFSDLDCRPMDEPPAPNVIWVCLDNPGKEVKFGQLIHVNS